jgi:RNA polymerase sigma-70 factor (ECF subfamily)
MRADTDVDPRRIGTDPDAFEAFYRAHAETVQRYVARRVSDPHVAADLTADIFLAVIDAAPTYRPGLGRPIAWLHGIARNLVADACRRDARELRAVSRVGGRALLDTDGLARAEERIDAERAARTALAAMAVLPDDERAVLELVALDGLTVTDAADVLGVKPVTARVRLHRARRKVRPHLEAAPSPGNDAASLDTVEVTP